MSSNILIYGAYGYTGVLCTELAAAQGLDPVLAGRDPERLEALATRHGFAARSFGLDAPGRLDKGLEGIDVVLHCAGPFSRTSEPMVDACLRTRTHYLDITGEIDVFEACARRDAEAEKAGVLLMPGTGFDVVPSDCLAAHVAGLVEQPSELFIAILGSGKPSHGTATTMIESLGQGNLIRKGGQIVPSRLGTRTRHIDFGAPGVLPTMGIPWGDVSTAYHTTGVPNIEVHFAVPRPAAIGARLASYVPGIVGSGPVKRMLQKRVDGGPAGPTAAERRAGKSFLYAEAIAHDGTARAARLRTPEGYTLTAASSIEIARRGAAGEVPTGFQTPGKAFGADFVLQFEGVEREDI